MDQEAIIDHLKDLEFPRDWHFTQQAGPPTKEDLETWRMVKAIRDNARSCNEEGDPKPCWANEVYSRLLYTSLSDPRYRGSVRYRNM